MRYYLREIAAGEGAEVTVRVRPFWEYPELMAATPHRWRVGGPLWLSRLRRWILFAYADSYSYQPSGHYEWTVLAAAEQDGIQLMVSSLEAIAAGQGLGRRRLSTPDVGRLTVPQQRLWEGLVLGTHREESLDEVLSALGYHGRRKLRHVVGLRLGLFDGIRKGRSIVAALLGAVEPSIALDERAALRRLIQRVETEPRPALTFEEVPRVTLRKVR
jgi:hypothetical protein